MRRCRTPSEETARRIKVPVRITKKGGRYFALLRDGHSEAEAMRIATSEFGLGPSQPLASEKSQPVGVFVMKFPLA